MQNSSIHGYNPREVRRLQDQPSTLVGILDSDMRYRAGGRVLEAGCGVGTQTVTLAQNSPGALITSIDISQNLLQEAEKRLAVAGLTNVRFQQADIFDLRFNKVESFDHVFVCFVLEHLASPVNALKYLLSAGTTILRSG
jgi:ubiquinone/menaquinone biosynthesis C-methylase UbiE